MEAFIRLALEAVLCGAFIGAAWHNLKNLPVGTKSLLFGYHAVWLHPLMVAWGWKKATGKWPRDPRIWAACALHDVGYWGKPNMDELEGETHPFLGAKIMYVLFDLGLGSRWYTFTLYHSRKMARTYFADPSMLCWADKWAFLLYPKWALGVLFKFSGEFAFYKDTLVPDMATGERVSGLRDFDEWHHQAWMASVEMLKKEGFKP